MKRSTRLLRATAAAAAIAFLALAWAQQPPPAHAVLTDGDGDFVLDLTEVVTGSDPEDPASTPEDRGADFVLGTRLCVDGVDNDGDGLTDGDDPGCLDGDGDIVSNAMESFLGSDPADGASFPEDSRFDVVLESIGFGFITTCADAADNDGDGLTDGDDPGCSSLATDGDDFDDVVEKRFGSDPGNANSVPEHDLANPGSCSDGRDNDLDGLTDGAEVSCRLPANDDLADATIISTLPFTDSLKMTAATREPNEARASCGFSEGVSVWYSYDAAADGVLVADTIGSDFPAGIAVFTQSGSRLTEVACSFNFDLVRPNRLAFSVETGETYFVQVSGFLAPDFPATLTFNLEEGIPPANDSYANATMIGGLPFSDAADTTAATTQFGEPGSNCAYDGVSSSVWYRFTPTADTLLVADTDGSDFAAVIGVWTDSKFGLTRVACSSGFFFGGPLSDIVGAKLAFETEAGRTYWFQLSGVRFGPSSGNLAFSLEVGVPPANDDFANASMVGALPFDDSVDTLTAGSEDGEPFPSCSFFGNTGATVWYRFSAVTDTAVLVESTGANFQGPAVGVYQGSSLADLSQVACGYPGYPESELAFQASAGQTYFIQAVAPPSGGFFFGGRSGESAGFPFPPPIPEIPTELQLHLEALEIPSCPAADFSIDDPAGDTLDPRGAFGGSAGDPPDPATHDITSVSGGSNADTLCLTVELAGAVAAPDELSERSISAHLDFDTDEDPNTGYPGGFFFGCGGTGAGLGVDASADLTSGYGILLQLYQQFFEPPPPEGGEAEEAYAFALFDETSFTLVIPLSLIGGDDGFSFAMYVSSPFGPISDCAPNEALIHSPEPLQAGDVNCDGTANAIDGLLLLQLYAGMIPSVPCRHLGDVNGTGVLGPIDALLIMQFDAGLLPELELPAAG